MLVDRRVFMVKVGKMDEVLELLRVEQARVKQVYDYSGATRNYVCYVGTFNQLVLESEWNNLAEWEAFWSDWAASPEGMAFQEKWGPYLSRVVGLNCGRWLSRQTAVTLDKVSVQLSVQQ